MSPSHDLRQLLTIPVIVVLVLAATTSTATGESCFVERGRIVTPNLTAAAVSGRLVAVLQRGGWDTRPMLRVAEMNPHGLIEVGRWQATWTTDDVHLDAATAFVAADFGLVALDLRDPHDPVELDFFDLIGADNLAVDGDFAYVATDGVGGNGWFDILDISDPTDLQEPGGLYWGRPEPYWGKTAIDASGGIVVLACYQGVVAIDVSDPRYPAERGLWTRDGARDLVFIGDLVAVAVTSWVDPDDVGVAIIDPSQPEAPTSVGFWPAPSAVHSVAEYGGAVLVGTESDGLFLLDVQDPADPTVIDSWHAPGFAVDHLATAWPTIVVADIIQGAVVLGLAQSCLPPRRPSGRVGR